MLHRYISNKMKLRPKGYVSNNQKKNYVKGYHHRFTQWCQKKMA